MTIPEILEELEQHTGEFPMTAMQAAIEQREAIQAEDWTKRSMSVRQRQEIQEVLWKVTP